jgi:carbon storage regulator CsrA
MLVLTRKAGETLDVDGPARIAVLACHGSHVKLGIEADLSTSILRSELAPKEPVRLTVAGSDCAECA